MELLVKFPQLHDLRCGCEVRHPTYFLWIEFGMLFSFKMQVHMSSPNVGQFIDLLVSIPAEGYDNSFSYVMSEWTKQQGNYALCTFLFSYVSKRIHAALSNHTYNEALTMMCHSGWVS